MSSIYKLILYYYYCLKEYLINNTNKKILHKIIFNKNTCPHIDENLSSTWLKFGKLNPRIEGALTMLQDRNFYKKDNKKCPHCLRCKNNIDHVATKCDKLLNIYKKLYVFGKIKRN